MPQNNPATPLQSHIIEKIRQAGGRIPFRDYMEEALYHPTLGYYMNQRPKLGREGDFVTAPEITSLFGELLTLQCIEIWQAMGSPSCFTVLEAGAGSGRLAQDMLTTASHFVPFHEALRYAILERSGDFQQRQKVLLNDSPAAFERVMWHDSLASLQEAGGFEGVILSNEFLDAFPVHWVEVGEKGLLELAVAEADGGLKVESMAPEAPLEAACLDHLDPPLEPGVRTEVGLDGRRWAQEAAKLLQCGVMISIDYGYTGAEYYHPSRIQGTLCGYYQHEQVNDPLAHPGEMDLTAHVDFSALAADCEKVGLETLGYTTQGWFLMGLGILERLEMLRKKMGPGEALENLEKSVRRLIMPEAMGERFKVLAQGRGLKGAALAGFRLNDQRQRL